MSTTATADELGSEIVSKAERIRELSTSASELEKSLAAGREVIAKAIARGNGEDADAARKSVLASSNDLTEMQSAIELLTRERMNLEARRKQAEKREAAESADRLAVEAAGAVDAVTDAVSEAVRSIGLAVSDARYKLNLANGEDQRARGLNGHQQAIIERSRFSQKPGLEEFLDALHKYEHRRDFIVGGNMRTDL